jgi:FlaG protein
MTDIAPDAIGRLIPMPSLMGGASVPGPSPAPNSPPAELQQEYVTAQKVAAELEARQLNVHFGVDGETGKVRVELIGGSGEVVREIPATHLLDALSGCGVLEGV